MKTTAKFRASRRLRFADTKRMMSPEMSPKSFGTFEKQAPIYFLWTLRFPCRLQSTTHRLIETQSPFNDRHRRTSLLLQDI